GLSSVEEQLVFYKKNEVIFCEQLTVLKRDISCKDSELSMLKSELEKLKQEKESNQLKIKKFDNASKSLNKLIGSQTTDKSRKGVGFVSYNAVLPPPTGLFSPPKFDLSYYSLEEFQQPEFEGYGHKTSKSVSEDISNEVRESPDAPLVKEFVSDDKLEKKTIFPTVAKIEFVRPKQQEKQVRKPVKHAKMYRLTAIAIKGKGWPKAVNTARPNSTLVNTVRANQVNAVKASTCWVWRPTKLNSASITLKRHNYVDARGRSKHMTGNMSYLSDFKKFDGGYVTFGKGAKRGKNTVKGTLKTSKLDFEDVYFVKELQFNLFSFSQMCDKKNNVLFTDTRCFVLSPDIKLANESHVNFKTINKLVKENLVRGLPTKRFENVQTCVACLKGKQHKASGKSKIQNSITQPLFMLHMDLFGPTFVSSLMNKKYCLVVTDDYNRFTWVFFLATKDETSGIFKRFITEIENLVDKKVKIIRCDNGTEFRNRVMSAFCEDKGIKKEFSAARTPQQNGVAERRNRTLIEVARAMLADSKLPTTFWAEAVKTACYVQNRVLVVKPHNKTPYELFRGRIPALSFMRPFRCHVTILNTLDYLGKFDGKSNEGLFVRYSMNSKAFRVYNIRTRKVEENLHIRFLEDKPIIAGDGPKWLFDIDVLTKSMNYVPAVAGTNSNDLVGTKESIGNASNDEPQPSSDAGKKDDEGVNKESGIDDQERPKNITTTPLEARHADFFGDETEVYMSNITTTYPVPSTPNTRIHKDHSLDHVIGDVQSGVQTRRMTKTTNEQGFISAGYTQEEGIDYDEVFAPVARIEAIRLFLAYASFKDFVVYQMDVKSAFLYGKIKEEVYVCQPPGFEDPEFHERVYKVEKALYGLHQAPKACQDKYVDEILKKFGFSTVKTTSIPMETSKPLMKDENAEDVNVHFYRSMIGSLMYLTSLRPDIMFVDSPFDLEAYIDSDYAGAIANSTTKAEYVVAASCCGQVLWIQNQMLDYGYNFMNTKIFIDNESTICIGKNLVFHSKTKHIEIRHHFIRYSNEKKLIQMIKIHTYQNVADLLTKAFDVGRFQYLIASIGMLNL
ncbi:putative ribonuclease H-like domain-containing protein, partial [Tanacetum coccineum]